MFKQAQHDGQAINGVCCNPANENVLDEKAWTNTPNEDELDNVQMVIDNAEVDTLNKVIFQDIFCYSPKSLNVSIFLTLILICA
jgi:hypothetical protein